jgi:hypothetical protein
MSTTHSGLSVILASRIIINVSTPQVTPCIRKSFQRAVSFPLVRSPSCGFFPSTSSFPHFKGKDSITVSIDAIVAAGGKRGSTFLISDWLSPVHFQRDLPASPASASLSRRPD